MAIVPGFIWVHFDCEKEFVENGLAIRTDLAVGLKKDSETDQTTGFYCRWRTRIQGEAGQSQSAIAEDSYALHDIPNTKATDLYALMAVSLFQFSNAFMKKLEMDDHRFKPSFQIPAQTAADLLEAIRQEHTG